MLTAGRWCADIIEPMSGQRGELRWTGQKSCSRPRAQRISGSRVSTGPPLTANPLFSRPCSLLAVERIGQRPLWAQSLELPEPAMQPLPAGAFLEEVAEETPAQPESEPKVLDPEEDLLCIAKTFSYLRESGEFEKRSRPCCGKSSGESLALSVESPCPGESDGEGAVLPMEA